MALSPYEVQFAINKTQEAIDKHFNSQLDDFEKKIDLSLSQKTNFNTEEMYVEFFKDMNNHHAKELIKRYLKAGWRNITIKEGMPNALRFKAGIMTESEVCEPTER